MKVIHILKRMETVDHDIKDLRKMEKSLSRNKSFTTPIYMSIEKQINILLGERIKLLELQIKDPPAELVELIEGPAEEKEVKPAKSKPAAKKAKAKKSKAKSSPAKKKEVRKEIPDDIEIPMLTQDLIDERISNIKEKKVEKPRIEKAIEEDIINDESIKLLDVALEKGTLNKSELDKEKKKVKFFKDNFPSR